MSETRENYTIDENQIECVKHWRDNLKCSYRRIATLFNQNFPEVNWVSQSCQWSGETLCKLSKTLIK